MRALICSCLLALPAVFAAQAATASDTERRGGSAAPRHGRIPPPLRRSVDRTRRPVRRGESLRSGTKSATARKAPSGSRTCASGGAVAAAIRRSPIDGVTGPTKPVGTHQLKFAGDKAPLAALAPGKYKLVVEAARETGGREVVRVPFEWPAKSAQALTGKGTSELGTIALNLSP